MSGSEPDRRRHRSLLEDERAIEGLPIRLVIALVVGVAALGIMMNVLGTFDFGAEQEVGVDFVDGAVVSEGDPGITVKVVDDKTGEPIPEADVIVRGDTLSLKEPYTATANEDGEITFDINKDGTEGDDVRPDWRTTQDTGKIEFEIIPPADAPYTEDQANDKMTVIR